MSRLIEWLMAVIGVATTTGIAAVFAQQQSSVAAPGESLWPLPGFVLLEIALLGLIGLVAVALDGAEHARYWGAVTWGVVGALISLVFLGIFSVGPFLFPAVLAFSIAAVLADRRRGRRSAPELGLAAVTMAANAVLLVALIVSTRP